ncbi:MAG TPA: ABC-F family ATP-binding cassette domain-containing protein, partial [Candidatus Hydrogenedentes bacterium]|nr:ABC-F family ATP-binding cassette domain-containing protein [Candidatus Hydrogenedentota bacterium]
MSLVRLENISKFYSGEPVLAGVNLRIEEGERIALIGRNGSGKTTLFRLVTGETEPDGGVIECRRRARIVYLAQIPQAAPGETVYDVALTPFAELLRMEKELHVLEMKMASGEEAAVAAYGEFQQIFAGKGGYEFRTRVRQILGGLGFRPETLDAPFETLSGGWRARLMLSLTLLQEADLLLLDEPENHLDMDAREWLEEHLLSRPEAVALISHDRRMVNVLAKRIIEVERGQVTGYTGNYDAWLKEKALRREQHRKAYERQEAFIRKEQAWIDRFRAKNTKASQAQSRIKRLEKMELLDAPESELDIAGFALGDVTRSGETVLEAKNLAMAYDAP